VALAGSSRYALACHPDGSLAMRADCNEAGGHYRLDGSRIATVISHAFVIMADVEGRCFAGRFF